MIRSKTLFLTIASLAVATSVSQAGTIFTSILTDDETNIVNLGTTVVSAANFGSTSGGTQTVDINGIIHTAASAANNGSGNDLLSGATINSFFDGQFRGATAYSGDMQNLMGGIAGNGGPIVITISGLTIGQEYLFQGYWEAENTGQIVQVTFDGVDTLGGIDGDPQGAGTGDDLGVLISYSFTATDTDLVASLNKTSGVDNVWWQGYSLQTAIPEPSTALLSLCGVFALLKRRRI